MTPVDDFTTHVWAVISLRLRIPSRLVVPLVTPLATRILRQDRAVLGLQTETIRRFGGERLASTEIDVLGPQIWHLMTVASRREFADAGLQHEHRVRMAI
jgi:hypothetical protein